MLECLQRALRVADSCMETATSIELFVEILDRYVYYFDQQNESVSLIGGACEALANFYRSQPSILMDLLSSFILIWQAINRILLQSRIAVGTSTRHWKIFVVDSTRVLC